MMPRPEVKVRGHRLLRLLIALAALLALSGCVTLQSKPDVEPADPRQQIAGLPQIRLAGAHLAEVKSIAMGAAHSKGWTLLTEEADRIVLERPMDPAAPQAVALGINDGSAPVIEVTTYFVEDPGGVFVALAAKAHVMTGEASGEQGARAFDYTDLYRSDLMRSLKALRETWAANRERVTTALASRRSRAQSPAVASSTSGQPPQETAQDAPSSATSATSPESNLSVAEGATLGDNLVQLPEPPEVGVWAYYAEHYATTRGCTLSGQGAVLVERLPDHGEIHEVKCQNRQAFRLRCQNGICRSLR